MTRDLEIAPHVGDRIEVRAAMAAQDEALGRQGRDGVHGIRRSELQDREELTARLSISCARSRNGDLGCLFGGRVIA